MTYEKTQISPLASNRPKGFTTQVKNNVNKRNILTKLSSKWLVAGSAEATTGIHIVQGPGLYCGDPIENSWTQVGNNQSTGFCLHRIQNGVIMGANHGMYALNYENFKWKQLHDETLTEVLTATSYTTTTDLRLIAGSPYGVASSYIDRLNVTRWVFHSDKLNPNERFTNTLLVDSNDQSRWIAGTEAGIIMYLGFGKHNKHANLCGIPVRALHQDHKGFWAGCDRGGIYHSCDGLKWNDFGGRIETPIYNITSFDDEIVAATGRGILQRMTKKNSNMLGPQMLFADVAIDPKNSNQWLAAASPGGLWFSSNKGKRWRQIIPFKNARSILPPEKLTP